jgi:CHAT domain-containing protein/tetratricopeptide (TPR) repeat protein
VLVGVASPAASQSVGDARPESIRARLVEGRYTDAETDAERLVAALETTEPRESSAVASVLDLLVEALVRNGKGADPRTLRLAERSIAQKEARAGSTAPELAVSLRNLGDVFVEAGDYQRARDSYERALALAEREAGPGTDVANLLDRLAQLLVLIEKYDDALKASDRTLAMRTGAIDRDDRDMARTLEVRGLLLQRRGEYPRARTVLEQALAIREPRPIHPDLAETLSLLAEQRRFEGDLLEARRYAARSVAVAEETLRPDHPNLATYLRIQAIPTGDLGDLAGARALRERAVGIAERSLGLDHLAVAVQLNDLALSHVREGDYAAARGLYERALRIYERRLGPTHSGVITEVYNLAVVNARLGDFLEARRQFDRAIATWERVVGPAHPFVALALSALAEMLTTQGRYREASALYERALAIRERSLGRNHRDVAQSLTLLATSLAKAGQVRRAYELSEQALAIWDQLPERDSQRVAVALTSHGSLQAQRGDLPGAEASYDRSLMILERIVGPSHPEIAHVRVLQAATLAKTGQLTQALDDALVAEEIGRNHLRFMLRYLPERQGIEYAAQRPKGLDLSLSLMAPETDGSDVDRVFDGLIRSRGLLLDEMAWRRHLSTDATRPDLAPLWTTLVSARQRFANLFIRGVSQQDPQRSKALLDEARRQREEAERAFADRSGAFRDELARIEIGLSDVRAALPRGSALVAFARYDRTPVDRSPASARTSATRTAAPAGPVPSYAAFILKPDQAHVGVALLGPSRAIETLVARWQTEIMRATGGGSPSETEQAYRTAATALRQRVWDPLRKYLNGATTVFIVPDGVLNLVSFAALPVGQTSYLAEQGPLIHFLSVERDLLSPPSPTTTGRGLLAVGGATFDDATLFARPSKPAGSPARVAARPGPTATALRASCGTLQSIQFPPLAGTAKEAHDIASFWKDSESSVLEGRAADERSFKRDATGRRVLHLATHGFFLADDCQTSPGNTRSVGGLVPAAGQAGVEGRSGSRPVDNPLLKSGLALAGANRRAAAGPDEEDGILTAEEVSAMNLDGVEWAVLSACETALGEIRSGEGVFGLRRAFQVAGARTIIMSLWAVDDIATQTWMRALYQNRLQQGLTTAAAIRAANLSVLTDRRARHQSAHPFYWAAFVAAGNWR